MSYRTRGALTPQDRIMLQDGYVRISVVATALGVPGSTVLRRVERAAYKGVRAGTRWYVRLDDVYDASDTSSAQKTRLSDEVSVLQKG